MFKLFPDIPRVFNAKPDFTFKQKECFLDEPGPQIPRGKSVVFEGFFQVKDYLPKRLTPSWNCIKQPEDLLVKWQLDTEEKRNKTVFVHVRLGDFKTHPHHFVNLSSYFVRAMAKYPSDTRFLVFSEEPDDANNYSDFDNRCIFVKEADELRTLFLMSHCHRGAITANSTFSWWGAYFARQSCPDINVFRVCMPSQWMVTHNTPTCGIYPIWATIIEI